jgi:hypothetical protein
LITDRQAFGILLVGLFGDLPARLWSLGFSVLSQLACTHVLPGLFWALLAFFLVLFLLTWTPRLFVFPPAFVCSPGLVVLARLGGDFPVLLCFPGFLGLSRLSSALPGSSFSCLPGQVGGLSGFRFFPGLIGLWVFRCSPAVWPASCSPRVLVLA